MDNTMTQAARQTMVQLGQRITGILSEQVDVSRHVSPEWSVRDATSHLAAVTNLYAEMAAGAPSPLLVCTPRAASEFNAAAIADIAETDPAALATMLSASVERFVEGTRERSDDDPVSWHAGIPLQLAHLSAILAAEYVLHGYDIAAAYNVPWPLDPAQAGLGLFGRGSVFDHVADPATSSGHTGSYLLNLGDIRLTVRFVDGNLTVDPAAGPADCEIVSDPVSMLMLTAGRVSQAQLVALGLLRFGGKRPDLATGFIDKLYIF